jgi:hypothetical protein
MDAAMSGNFMMRSPRCALMGRRGGAVFHYIVAAAVQKNISLVSQFVTALLHILQRRTNNP